MMHVAKLVSMAKTPEEIKESYPMAVTTAKEAKAPDAPVYPYGLCISLCQDELAKLNLDDGCDVGDTIHIFAMARVTSKSSSMNEASGPNCRIELQITDMSVENEDDEDDAEDAQMRDMARRKRFYGDTDNDEG